MWKIKRSKSSINRHYLLDISSNYSYEKEIRVRHLSIILLRNGLIHKKKRGNALMGGTSRWWN